MANETTTPGGDTAAPQAAPAVTLPPVPPEMLRTTRIYELMVILDPTLAQREWDKIVEWAKGLLTDRYGALILKLENWADSRKLAYEIKGLRRGSYLLVYFRAKPSAIAGIENDLRLDDRAVRHLVIVHETEPDYLLGKVRVHEPDEFEDDYGRRDDYEDFDDYDRDDY